MDWNAAVARADLLARQHRSAAEVLRYGRAVLRFQRDVYHRARTWARGDPQRLDASLLASLYPSFLQLVEKYGTDDLCAQAHRAQERQGWEDALRGCWREARDRTDLLGRTILQPYVQYLAERWQVEVGIVGDGTGACPFCGRLPVLSVLNGRRVLVCSLCSTEWEFPPGRCPGCRAARTERLRHRSFAHVHVEACAACGQYLKVVDLRKEPGAFPVVDELAATPLDGAARVRGFSKLEVNLAGM
jgi:FdhE protein